MADGVRQWFKVLRDGSMTPPRSRHRSAATVRVATASAAPALRAWTTAGHRSLREISRQDVTAVLAAEPLRRNKTLIALRSLFRFLKARRLVFTNPTAHFRGIARLHGQPLPINLAIVHEAINSTNPARAALAALIAFHAPLCNELCDLRLADVHDGRLRLPGRAILLAAPVARNSPAGSTNAHNAGPTPVLGDTFLEERIGALSHCR